MRSPPGRHSRRLPGVCGDGGNGGGELQHPRGRLHMQAAEAVQRHRYDSTLCMCVTLLSKGETQLHMPLPVYVYVVWFSIVEEGREPAARSWKRRPVHSPYTPALTPPTTCSTSSLPTHPMIPSVFYYATVPYVYPTVCPATYKQVCSTCRLGTAEAKMRPRGSARGVPTTAGGYGTTGKAKCRRWAEYGT